MYTLINTSRTLCCGVFETVDDADNWAKKHTPELGLQSIELLLDAHTRDVIEEFEAFTAEPATSNFGFIEKPMRLVN